MPRFADYHRTVVGFHGTTRETALRIVTEQQFKPSQNDDDWLGHGVYFWEYAPKQAWDWAKTHYAAGEDIAVVGSMIRLGNCLDLLDPENAELLVAAKGYLEQTIAREGRKMPRNFNSNKYLDCAVFQTFYDLNDAEGDAIDTSRAVFVPSGSKQRLWLRSGLYYGSHVQLCVRNTDCILGTWIVPQLEEEA